MKALSQLIVLLIVIAAVAIWTGTDGVILDKIKTVMNSQPMKNVGPLLDKTRDTTGYLIRDALEAKP